MERKKRDQKGQFTQEGQDPGRVAVHAGDQNVRRQSHWQGRGHSRFGGFTEEAISTALLGGLRSKRSKGQGVGCVAYFHVIE